MTSLISEIVAGILIVILLAFGFPVLLVVSDNWTDYVWEWNQERKSHQREKLLNQMRIEREGAFTLLIGKHATFFQNGDRSRADIRIHGHKLSPKEVEDYFHEHP